ncbi:hypothetical protein H0W26_00525 [Candidatus Dependentiae bacterium]|nr:hypothetical protein [Candidatus Dependentiae bacterium]
MKTMLFQNRYHRVALALLLTSNVFMRASLSVTPEPGIVFTESHENSYITLELFKELGDFWFAPSFSQKGFSDAKQIRDAESFDFSQTRPGDIFFVRNPQAFLEKIYPHIKTPYVIVTHGYVPDMFKEEYVPYLSDPNIIAWFTIHAGKGDRHEKVIPLPLGIRKWPDPKNKIDLKKTNSLFVKLRNQKLKSHLLYMNFADSTDPERKLIRRKFTGKDFCFEQSKVPTGTFLQQMSLCKFTLAPRGLAPCDTFRVWESLIVGSIPIIKKTEETNLSLYEGLPVLMVDSWEQVTKEFLEEEYKKICSKTYSNNKLYMSYWINEIITKRNNFLQKHDYPLRKTNEYR